MSNFADLMHSARERAGLTQKDLAHRVGIDDSYVSRLERGTAPPPVRDKVLAIAEVLGLKGGRERLLLLLAAGCANTNDLEILAGEVRDDAAAADTPLLFASGVFDMRVPRVPQ